MLFIFDMGGVVTTNFAAENQMYKRLGMTEADFFSICKSGKQNIWELLETGKITVSEFWTSFYKIVGSIQHDVFDGIIDVYSTYNLNHALDLQNISSYDFDLFRLCFHPVLNTETVKIIKSLKENGHRVVCGTNTIDSHWENHMERGDYSFFDQTYASNKIGIAKPDLNFWETIMDFEGFEPSETFFTDDKRSNCKAAAECGINVHQFLTADDLRKAWSKYL